MSGFCRFTFAPKIFWKPETTSRASQVLLEASYADPVSLQAGMPQSGHVQGVCGHGPDTERHHGGWTTIYR